MKLLNLSLFIIAVVLFSSCNQNCKNEQNQKKEKSSVDLSQYGIKAFPYLDNEWFRVFISDNDAKGSHKRGGYNGVAALIPHHAGQNIFVPSYAGLNYETLSLKGNTGYDKTFEPRYEEMKITYSDNKKVVLEQAKTSHSEVSAKITFTIEEPWYMHQSIELVFHKRFVPDGEKQAFTSLWASYMHIPNDKSLYMRMDTEESDPLKGWYSIFKKEHSYPYYEVVPLPEDKELKAKDHLEIVNSSEANQDSTLLGEKANNLPLEFYYGLLFDDLVFLQMFKQPGNFRFAYSPTGGGWHCNWIGKPVRTSPAWDYILHLDDVEIGKTYRWDCCIAVKPFQGRKDILEEVEKYKAR